MRQGSVIKERERERHPSPLPRTQVLTSDKLLNSVSSKRLSAGDSILPPIITIIVCSQLSKSHNAYENLLEAAVLASAQSCQLISVFKNVLGLPCTRE